MIPSEDMGEIAGKAQAAQYMETFKNYGLLLNSMTPLELAEEIGLRFPGQQAAIIVFLAAKLFKDEEL